MRLNSFFGLVCFITLQVIVLPASGSSTVPTFRTVALYGEPAPEIGPDVFNQNLLTAPVINESGQVLFRTSLTGSGLPNNVRFALWLAEPNGTRSLVYKELDQAPGLGSGVLFGSVTPFPNLSDTGQIAVANSLQGLTGLGPNINSEGIFLGTPGSVQPVAVTGQPAPGSPTNHVFAGLYPPFVNNSGQVSFIGTEKHATQQQSGVDGIWSTSGGQLELIVKQGWHAPGTSNTTVFKYITPSALTDSGATLLSASVEGPDVTFENSFGLWVHQNGVTNIVFRSGDPVPGSNNNLVFGGPSSPPTNAINNTGDIAFFSFINGGGQSLSSIWAVREGNLVEIVREGQQVPDQVQGLQFKGMTNPIISGSGLIAYRGSVVGTGIPAGQFKGALFYENENGLEMVAREGQLAPGTQSLRFDELGRPVMNESGIMVFRSTLVDGNNQYAGIGVWAVDPDLGLFPVAVPGMVVDLNTDPLIEELKTIKLADISDYYTSSENGTPTGLNDAGRLIVFASFTDSSPGMFVTSVPEPGSLAFMGLTCIVLVRRARRRM